LNEFLQIIVGILNTEFQDLQIPDMSTEIDGNFPSCCRL
jgi:hypothetical protein